MLDRQTEEKFRRDLAASKAETDMVRQELYDARVECGAKDAEITRLREHIAALDSHKQELEQEYELLKGLLLDPNTGTS